MSEGAPFPGEPADSQEAIMRATWLAIEEHGYAGLSIQRIADEAGLSKSSVYHHYEDKDALLSAFVEYILSQFMDVFAVEAGDTPETRLRTFIDLLVADDMETEQDLPEDKRAVYSVYVELRAQAVREPTIREQFDRADELFTGQLQTILEDGQAAGAFQSFDAERVARYLSTVLAGHTFLLTTQTEFDRDPVVAELDRFIDERVLA